MQAYESGDERGLIYGYVLNGAAADAVSDATR